MQDINEIEQKIVQLKKIFQYEGLVSELAEIETKMTEGSFWDDPQKAAGVQKRRRICEQLVDAFKKMDQEVSDTKEFAPLAAEGDAELQAELEKTMEKLGVQIAEMEFRRILGGELDSSSAIVEINSGAGGTESQDWVAMLTRMFMRWAEAHKLKAELVDELPGEGAGYKSVAMTIDGDYAYGYLKSEMGIHRLVRISPFDSNARRHTSFASVMVLPQVDDDIEIEINEADLRVDTFRASGAGGQHVNKTESAVRITHLPTNIVVSSQSERSQHKNRATCMKMLKAHLYKRQEEENRKNKEKLAGEKKDASFGSQIRSYVLHPYQMVKDHRTEHQTSQTQAVLDGDLDEFMKEYLLKMSGK
ncbi:MAG: peptide chain release factor 2 [Proteobacteria bacterium]|jgi:peptide chain release factor 2|nr:peptide chain release factor 2 [Pseudomonadota bacterium]